MTFETDLTAEIDLASQVAAGDERAFREFYERYADSLYLFIYHVFDGAKEDAEEIWQDTLVAAVSGISRYRGESRMFSWLCAIARRKAIDQMRRNGRINAQTVMKLPETLELSDDSLLPEYVLENRVVRSRVVETLEGLSPEYRKGLTERYINGHSVEEISVHLQKTYKATESLLSRARQAFKELFLRLGD